MEEGRTRHPGLGLLTFGTNARKGGDSVTCATNHEAEEASRVGQGSLRPNVEPSSAVSLEDFGADTPPAAQNQG